MFKPSSSIKGANIEKVSSSVTHKKIRDSATLWFYPFSFFHLHTDFDKKKKSLWMHGNICSKVIQGQKWPFYV